MLISFFDILRQGTLFCLYFQLNCLIQAFFWSVVATTSAGYNINPTDDMTTWFSLISIVVGVLMLAYVIGSSAVALSYMDLADADKRIRIEVCHSNIRFLVIVMCFQGIQDFFNNQNEMDSRLKKRIISYYDYSLTRTSGVEHLQVMVTGSDSFLF